MNRKFLIVSMTLFIGGFIIFAFGVITFSQISKAIEEYPSKPLDKAGSAGPPYPSYDGTWVYFEISSVLFALGILILIWKRKKKNPL